MTRKIIISFSKGNCTLYLGMYVPEKLEVSGLLELIKAEDLMECNPCNKHVKLNNLYKKTGRLENKGKYLVRTNDIDETLKSIKVYKDDQESL